MADTKRENIDNVLTYIILKKLLTPIVKTQAYKLKLVDATGKVIKSPETIKEKNALTTFDKFAFKLRRLLGGKLAQLRRFMYVQTLSTDLYNKLIVKGSVENRAEIKKIKKDVGQLAEKYDMEFNDFLVGLLNEDLVEGQDAK
jgi:hypothetical protein